jgi:gamma-glutamyltranspeptidase
MLDRRAGRDDPALWTGTSSRGMVVTAHDLATEAGVRMLEQGGNAVDAMVASSLALAVCEPAGSGLGGMAMMLLHDPASGFKVKNRRHPHFLIPGAPARSNAAPAMIMAGGRPRVVVGSTGSERATSGILQVLGRLRHQSPFEASLAPRLHCTPEGEVKAQEALASAQADAERPARRPAEPPASWQRLFVDPHRSPRAERPSRVPETRLRSAPRP